MPVFFRDLKQEMKRLPKPRNPRNYVRGLKPVKLEVLSSPGLKAVTFRANMEGEEDGPYLTTCKFLNIQNFSDEIEVGYIKTDVSGEEVYAKKPDLSKNPVQIKCSCDDFRFMFEYPLFRKKGLIGTYRRYTRQTPPPPVGYPFKNPDEYLGFCKHIWNLIGSLKKRNLVKD